jgi:hypothetical protein
LKTKLTLLAGLCRDYTFALFKMDAVCGQLRPDVWLTAYPVPCQAKTLTLLE